jgi:spore germination cell wall hydrolase CwlJ-like protein
LASFDPRTLDTSGASPIPPPEVLPPLDYPAVNRTLKGNLLMPRPRAPTPPEPEETVPVIRKKEKQRDYSAAEFDTAPSEPATAEPDIAMSLELPPEIDARILAGLPAYDSEIVSTDVEPDDAIDVTDPATRTARLFFGSNALGTPGEALEPWADGAEPTLLSPRDPDIKLAALRPDEPASSDGTKKSEGETIASKGEVTGEGHRPKTPAERLGLTGTARAKAEKCLTDAVYFESRGEPERGQIAVAQVVMNRVFSPFYPDSVCGVVYQNAHRHLACQFTFACEGKRLVVEEPEAWDKAKRIARDTLDGKLWLSHIGKSTHYHAYWVRPSWVREMKKMYKLGVHTFYRPLAWGNGADEPAWGSGAKAGDADLVTGSTAEKDAPIVNAVAMPSESIAQAKM